HRRRRCVGTRRIDAQSRWYRRDTSRVCRRRSSSAVHYRTWSGARSEALPQPGIVVPWLICEPKSEPRRPGGPYTVPVAASAPRIAVVQFPGTNCERETVRSVQAATDCRVELVWHADPFPVDRFAAAILPGGFAHGDHLRAGAIARFAPVMAGIQQFARAGGLVLGICNGFQVLLEAGLLPGAMLRNASLQFRSEWVHCRVERTDTPFTSACRPGQVLKLPVAHGEGNYVLPRLAQPDVGLGYCNLDDT